MKKVLVIIIMLLVLTGCSNESENEVLEENPFELDVSFGHYKAEEIYYKYNHYYAGMFYDENQALTMAIVEGAPDYVLASVEQSGLKIKLVQHSEAKLESIEKILLSRMKEFEIKSIGISQKDNWIRITVGTEVIISETLNQYVLEGIINVIYTDSEYTITPSYD